MVGGSGAEKMDEEGSSPGKPREEARRRNGAPPERLPKRGDQMKPGIRRMLLVLGAILALGIVLVGTAAAAAKNNSFRIVRPVDAPNGCLEGSRGAVAIRSLGPVEVMTVRVENLPPNTKYDLFLLQLPREPFGIAFYEGDIETNSNGQGKGRFVGRFNRETFAMAPDSGHAPVIHRGGPNPDDSTNPTFGPVHTYHLGLFFDSPRAARRAGCPGDVTPFNGKHRAGIKALSTRNFPERRGPLREVAP